MSAFGLRSLSLSRRTWPDRGLEYLAVRLGHLVLPDRPGRRQADRSEGPAVVRANDRAFDPACLRRLPAAFHLTRNAEASGRQPGRGQRRGYDTRRYSRNLWLLRRRRGDRAVRLQAGFGTRDLNPSGPVPFACRLLSRISFSSHAFFALVHAVLVAETTHEPAAYAGDLDRV